MINPAKRAEIMLIQAVLDVLKTHGLHDHCAGSPQWTGDEKQQAALAGLHQALCAYLPPLPEQVKGGSTKR